MKKLSLCFLAFFALAVLASGASRAGSSRETEAREQAMAQALCRAARAIRLPKPEEGPSIARDCSPAALLDFEPEAARVCALSQERSSKDEESRTANAAALAMIYANGLGEPRNYDLAMSYACRLDGTPAEFAHRIERLAERKAEPAGSQTFEICNGFTSGATRQFCKRRQEASEARFASRSMTLLRNPSYVKAAAALEPADSAYMDARMDELGLDANQRREFQWGERFRRDEGMRHLLTGAVLGLLPKLSPDRLSKSEQLLDSDLTRVLARTDLGATRLKAVEDTQRKWRVYRDTFVAWAQLASPDAADVFCTLLTEERASQLEELGH